MVVKYRVKELAKSRGITQFNLAQLSGVSLAVVQRLWQGRAPEGIRHNTLDSIAKALEVRIEELYAPDTGGEDGASVLRINKESPVAVAA
jgi:DNA-binding Xre family transcriptional regulator